ncbi:putative defense protein [Crassostrea virginica]|uniref:Defense protein n=1 Tax=Crassostrea virginica TaxID=6565 RepID=A0A8B8BNZ3_CRAVI|nr:putative defense protein [Crassostrea virginica]
MKVLAVFLLVHLFPGATPYSMGPPLGACAEMFPTGHGVAAQESLPPFDILVNATSYKVGDVIEITVNSTGKPDGEYYEGLMIQARRTACNLDNPSKGHGQFSVMQNDWFLETMDCEGNTKSAVVHKNHSHIESRTFYWTAPAPTGHLVFRATIVHNKETFWTGVLSPVIEDPSSSEVPQVCSGSVSIYHLPTPLIVILIALFIRQ